MALALRLAGAFVVHRAAGGPTILAPGPHPWRRFPPLGPRQRSWPFFWQGRNMRRNSHYTARELPSSARDQSGDDGSGPPRARHHAEAGQRHE